MLRNSMKWDVMTVLICMKRVIDLSAEIGAVSVFQPIPAFLLCVLCISGVRLCRSWFPASWRVRDGALDGVALQQFLGHLGCTKAAAKYYRILLIAISADSTM